MLVMRRRAGEGIVIGDQIEIEILEVSPSRVRLGIVAPDSVTIVRKEVALVREANLNAARTAPAQAIAWLSDKLRTQSGAKEARQSFDSSTNE